MKFNVETYITNDKNQYVASVVATYNNFDSAKIKYHQTLATFYNAADVLIGVVKITDEYGNDMSGFREVVDHRLEPEPTPTPNQGNTENSGSESTET